MWRVISVIFNTQKYISSYSFKGKVTSAIWQPKQYPTMNSRILPRVSIGYLQTRSCRIVVETVELFIISITLQNKCKNCKQICKNCKQLLFTISTTFLIKILPINDCVFCKKLLESNSSFSHNNFSNIEEMKKAVAKSTSDYAADTTCPCFMFFPTDFKIVLRSLAWRI